MVESMLMQPFASPVETGVQEQGGSSLFPLGDILNSDHMAV